MADIDLTQLKTKNVKKSKVPVKPVQIPLNTEREFQAQIRSYNEAFKKAVRTFLFPIIENASKLTRDTNDSIGEDVNNAIETLKKEFDFIAIAQNIASKMVNRVTMTNQKKTNNTVKNAIGVDLTNIIASENLTEFVEAQTIQNAELIKSVPQDAINDIRRIVLNGLTEGLRAEEITKQISGTSVNSTFNKMNNRIKTIARTEVAKLNSQITNRRLTNLGIKRAIWDATNDSRTRACHAARDGKEYDIAKGLYSSCDGLTIQPGQEINCRCVAVPIVE
jgi:SPP1 gp7 family putative phage head morphogenesis protein